VVYMLEDWQNRLLKDWHGRLNLKENRVVFKGLLDQAVVIPSHMYPLKEKKYTIFCSYNTENFIKGSTLEEKCIRAFDKVDSKVGECFSNVKMLTQELSQEGVASEVYVGWLFFDTKSLPIYHCFVVVDDNKILDYGVVFKNEDYEEIRKKQTLFTKEEERKLALEIIKRKRLLPNHERFEFGKVYEYSYYIACRCSSDEGLVIYKNLLSEYPNHVTYIKPHGSGKETIMQSMIKNLGDY